MEIEIVLFVEEIMDQRLWLRELMMIVGNYGGEDEM